MQLLPTSNFLRGLITEASPLTYPDGGAIVMDNFVIQREGSIARRKGIDLEGVRESFAYDASDPDVAKTSYEWNAVGMDGSRNYTVVQVGNELRFYDGDTLPLLENRVHASQKVYIPGKSTDKMSFASSFGRLIVAHGTRRVTVIEYDIESGDLKGFMKYLQIRDLYGVDDNLSLGKRPTVAEVNAWANNQLTSYKYNLFNEGWPQSAFPCVADAGNNATTDVTPIDYTASSLGYYPSHSDLFWMYAVEQPGKEQKAGVVGAYSPWFLEKSKNGSLVPPRGRFVLDVFQRGRSRWAAINRTELDFSDQELDFVAPTALDEIPEPLDRYVIESRYLQDLTLVLPFLRQDTGTGVGETNVRWFPTANPVSNTTTVVKIQYTKGVPPPRAGEYLLLDAEWREITNVAPVTDDGYGNPLTGFNLTYSPASTAAYSEPYGTIKVSSTDPNNTTQECYGYDTATSTLESDDISGLSVGGLILIKGKEYQIAGLTNTGGRETITITPSLPALEVCYTTNQGAEVDYLAKSYDIGALWYQIPGQVNYPTADLIKRDETEGSISHISYYAGRIWYSFREEGILEPDAKSLSLGNTVMFSRVAKNLKDIGECLYSSDPTGEELNEVVDSDGGFVTIPELGEVVGMLPMGDTLLILASNGVWQISGGEGPFTAKSISISRVTTEGVDAPESIVEAENSVYFWGKGGIYQIQVDPVSLKASATNISETTIQSLLNKVPSLTELPRVKGVYQVAEKRIRWLFNTTDQRNNLGANYGYYEKEVIYDLVLGCFYTFTLPSGDNVDGKPFIAGYVRQNADRDYISYLTVDTSGMYLGDVSVSSEQDMSFRDFSSYLDTGVDAYAEVTGGWVIPSDAIRWKGAPYLLTQCRQTETGVTDDLTGGVDFKTPSSCIARVQWDWTNTVDAGKWTPEFQAYKYMDRNSIALGLDNAGSGWDVSTSKRKLRGRGRALTVHYHTEPEKDLQLLGYTLTVNIIKV